MNTSVIDNELSKIEQRFTELLQNKRDVRRIMRKMKRAGEEVARDIIRGDRKRCKGILGSLEDAEQK